MSMPAENTSPRIDLRQLLRGIADAPALAIHDIRTDSRQLAPGDAYLAVQGIASHGTDYADEAVVAGAAAIVWDSDTGDAHRLPDGIRAIPVAGLAARMGEIANRWFDYPSAKLFVSGITGTNGKTTIAWLIAQCLSRLGRPAGYIGTLGYGSDDLQGSSLTTPACIDLHRMLAEIAASNAVDVALEVSSHGLQQDRVAGVEFDAAVFTNLSRDHIDYHGDMQAYGETKARLFLEHDLRHRIVNVDDAFGRELATRCADNVVRVAAESEVGDRRRAFLAVRSVDAGADGMQMAFDSSWGGGELRLPLVGRFNAINAASVLALLLSRHVPIADACNALAAAAAPPGRMQQVAGAEGPRVFVDYAHTPAALEAALNALRAHTVGRLWCVFGCGGDRDQGKRGLMGEVAMRFSDQPVVTTDNPRGEPPAQIIEAILGSMPADTIAVEDRAAAIAYAVRGAGDDDVVLIAGKGHENYQLVDGEQLPFSDYQVALATLQARAAGAPRT